MKDYEAIHEACQILDRHQDQDTTRNLHAEHDELYFCFDVRPEDLSEEERQRLEELKILYRAGDHVWFKFVSC